MACSMVVFKRILNKPLDMTKMNLHKSSVLALLYTHMYLPR